jgi:hypothetical protein
LSQADDIDDDANFVSSSNDVDNDNDGFIDEEEEPLNLRSQVQSPS